jgi:hypothetical protein
MEFKLITGMDGNTDHNPTLRTINTAIDTLDADDDNAYIVLDPSEAIEESIFLQTALCVNRKDGSDSYLIETRFQHHDDNFRQYKYSTPDKAEIKKYFEDYFINKKAPSIENWTCINDALKEEPNIRKPINIYEIAKTFSRRKSDVIYQGFEIKHGSDINGISFYQSIGEAVNLFRDIYPELGDSSNIYYSDDNKRFYCDIKIPLKWECILCDAARIMMYWRGDFIHIACLNNEDIFIEDTIESIKSSEKMIFCFLTRIIEKLIVNPEFLAEMTDYIDKPDYHSFVAVYSEIYNDQKREIYYVQYSNCDDFDISKYHQFLPSIKF